MMRVCGGVVMRVCGMEAVCGRVVVQGLCSGGAVRGVV